eukprot:TRINITY_DN15559_c0_g3_i2.p1 TRINITY_DN15559_c0_g3~~TRINITY_DN15559_c0_g3_i2.p1  ORF type:complete len:145 (-),score=24.32 TRINITY_DN15559_c0_g3_i2:204-638(-)
MVVASQDALLERRLLQEPLEKGAFPIERYYFFDEGEAPGEVKVYVKACEICGTGLDPITAFDEVEVTFFDKAFVIRAVSEEGTVFILRSYLFDNVKKEDCQFALSLTGHKITVTLRKLNPKKVWRSLVRCDATKRHSVAVGDFL